MDDIKNHETKAESAFELERFILFSDAVFAIAITLLVINLKFPDITNSKDYTRATFYPLFSQFLAFCISFFFIGISWTRHLRLCRFLRAYDNPLLFLNLLYLFFIVLFPFAASTMTGKMNTQFMIPYYIYIGVIFGTTLTHLVVQYYVFRIKPSLTLPGFPNTKKWFLFQGKIALIALTIISLLVTSSAVFVQTDLAGSVLSILLLALTFCIFLYLRIRAGKLKKAAKAEGMF